MEDAVLSAVAAVERVEGARVVRVEGLAAP